MQTEGEDYSIEVTQHGKYRLLTLTNMKKIDLYNTKEIEEVFKKGNAESIEDWMIDLSNIGMIDSSGLAGLSNQGMHLAKLSKKLLLINPKGSVKHLFAMTGFDKIFTIVPDKESFQG